MAYPLRLEQVIKLVADHRKQLDEPLLLAVYYVDPQQPAKDCVLEVLSHFGLNAVSWDNQIFEAEYNSSSGFPMNSGERLRLLLTNPVELRYAIDNNWPQLITVREAVAAGQYELIYIDGEKTEARDLLKLLAASDQIAA